MFIPARLFDVNASMLFMLTYMQIYMYVLYSTCAEIVQLIHMTLILPCSSMLLVSFSFLLSQKHQLKPAIWHGIPALYDTFRPDTAVYSN
ncbi:hypothetical protein V6N13_105430 [Hibiscus sabdariffa]|uniref:Uncharacterized protein n=1 Tax=Hibiscus sabdariffa TaxID=183260 RepID=A0ABR2EWV5_9ROSI